MRNRPITAPERDRTEIHAVRVILDEFLRLQPDLIPALKVRISHRIDLRPVGDDLPAMMPADPFVRGLALEILDQASNQPS